MKALPELNVRISFCSW